MKTNKKGYKKLIVGKQMKYLYSSKNTQILAEFRNEKGGLLNALRSEPFLKTIRNTKVLLN